jgi:hypothetical protein
MLANRSLMPQIVVCVVLFTLNSTDAAGAELSEAQQQEAQLHVDGVLASRDEPRSGVCKIVARSRGDETLSLFGNELAVFYAFDRNQGAIRCDRRYGNSFFQYARSIKESVLHVGGTNSVTREPPNKAITVEFARPFDIQLLSVCSWAAFELCLPWTKIEQHLTECDIVDAKREQDGIYFVALEKALLPSGKSRTNLWIDDAEQFKVVRMEERAILPSANGEVDLLQSETKTEWQKLGEYWVPKSLLLRDLNSGRNWEMSMSWEMVGQAIDESLFTPAGMNLMPGTLIANAMLPGKPITEEIVGVATAGGVPPAPDVSFMSLRSIFVVVNAAIVAVLIALIAKRSHARRIEGV